MSSIAGIGKMALHYYIDGILLKGPYMPFVSMAGRALLAWCHRYMYWGNGYGDGDDIVLVLMLMMILTRWPLGDFNQIFNKIIFKLISVTEGCEIPSEIALRWTSRELNDDKSTLVQVMAWCRQATSHYLNQCWPRSLQLYGVTRPQWVNSSGAETRIFQDY